MDFLWTFVVLELFALVQIGRGLWGELGADQIARYEKLYANIAAREEQAKELLAGGDAAGAAAKQKIADNLKRVAESAQEQAVLAANEATTILLTGLALLIAIKIIEGHYANIAYEKQYLRWRAKPDNITAGTSRPGLRFWGADARGHLAFNVVPLYGGRSGRNFVFYYGRCDRQEISDH